MDKSPLRISNSDIQLKMLRTFQATPSQILQNKIHYYYAPYSPVIPIMRHMEFNSHSPETNENNDWSKVMAFILHNDTHQLDSIFQIFAMKSAIQKKEFLEKFRILKAHPSIRDSGRESKLQELEDILSQEDSVELSDQRTKNFKKKCRERINKIKDHLKEETPPNNRKVNPFNARNKEHGLLNAQIQQEKSEFNIKIEEQTPTSAQYRFSALNNLQYLLDQDANSTLDEIKVPTLIDKSDVSGKKQGRSNSRLVSLLLEKRRENADLPLIKNVNQVKIKADIAKLTKELAERKNSIFRKIGQGFSNGNLGFKKSSSEIQLLQDQNNNLAKLSFPEILTESTTNLNGQGDVVPKKSIFLQSKPSHQSSKFQKRNFNNQRISSGMKGKQLLTTEFNDLSPQRLQISFSNTPELTMEAQGQTSRNAIKIKKSGTKTPRACFPDKVRRNLIFNDQKILLAPATLTQLNQQEESLSNLIQRCEEKSLQKVPSHFSNQLQHNQQTRAHQSQFIIFNDQSGKTSARRNQELVSIIGRVNSQSPSPSKK